MIRSFFRRVLRLMVRSAVIAGVIALVARLLRQERELQDREPPADGATTVATNPRPVTDDVIGEDVQRPAPSPPAEDGPTSSWVQPYEGVCPGSHPVKVKESSGIFHVPGGLAYDRTTPDRCYLDAVSAEADGFRKSKR